MKFLIINIDYRNFLDWLYRTHAGLEKQPFEAQMKARMDTLFGTADFYSNNIRKLGHEAWDVIPNIMPMQRQWARENQLRLESTKWNLRRLHGVIPWITRDHTASLFALMEAQIKHYRPDVLYSMAIELIGSDFLRKVRPYYRLAIVQHAAPHPKHDVSEYDLMLSSLPNYVDYYRQKGMKSDFFGLGFEPAILEKLEEGDKRHDIAFVGGLGGHHGESDSLLESLCERYRITIWGYGIKRVAKNSPIRRVYRGPIWGKEMYQVLRDSKIGLNRHIDIAGDYANNMRLYEVTGVGSLLLTDQKINLPQLFDPNRECIAYSSQRECVELIEFYLTHHHERESISLAGQRRTLNHYTWHHRMEELLQIVKKHL